MPTGRSFVGGFLNLFALLILYLGCFFISSGAGTSSQQRDGGTSPSRNKRRKVSPSSHETPLPRSASGSKYFPVIRSYLGHVFSFRRTFVKDNDQDSRPAADATIYPSDSSSPPENSAAAVAILRANSPDNSHGRVVSVRGAALSPTSEHPSFASRKDVYPCQACGEILSKPHLLELHQATRHSLSELSGDETSYNILQIIFGAGWKGKSPPVVHRVLKIHNAPRTLARFEEYREMVQSKAARYAAARAGAGGSCYERCIADGNERLRFYCSTSICSSRKREGGTAVARGEGGVCGSQYCSACAIVRHGFSGKHAELDGIATFSTSWAAHSSLPEDLEREFAFMRVRRAMLVCRVVAGDISYGGDQREQGMKGMDEAEEGAPARWWDSVAHTGEVQCCKIGQIIRGGGEEEEAAAEQQLVVFNQRAVLPCFLIIYSTTAA